MKLLTVHFSQYPVMSILLGSDILLNTRSNVVVEWLTLLLRIRGSRVQILARRPAILVQGFSCYS
jgi:hypothetical protein